MSELEKLVEWLVRQVEKILHEVPQASDPADPKPEPAPDPPVVPSPDEVI